jgi:hypothetical protein
VRASVRWRRSTEAQPGGGSAHTPAGCGAETARTCGIHAFVGAALMDFVFSALRFIVAVWSFIGFKVRVFGSLMNAPFEFPQAFRVRGGVDGVESKWHSLADETTECCETETETVTTPPGNRGFTIQS